MSTSSAFVSPRKGANSLQSAINVDISTKCGSEHGSSQADEFSGQEAIAAMALATFACYLIWICLFLYLYSCSFQRSHDHQPTMTITIHYVMNVYRVSREQQNRTALNHTYIRCRVTSYQGHT